MPALNSTAFAPPAAAFRTSIRSAPPAAATGGSTTAVSSGIVEPNGNLVPTEHGLVSGNLVEISGSGYAPYFYGYYLA